MTYLSVKEAGEAAGKNERTIRRWINGNKIKWTKIKGKYHIDRQSLREYIVGAGFKPARPDVGADPHVRSVLEDKSISDGQKSGHQKMSENETNKEEKYVRIPIKTYQDILRNIYQVSNEKAGEKNYKLEEGKEYTLMSDRQKMSDFADHNMSVNKYLKYPIASQEAHLSPVEMSDMTENNMSDFKLHAIEDTFETTPGVNMSDFSGHLSAVSDTSVDNSLDSHDIIYTENPFLKGYNDRIKKMSGQNEEMSGHNNRIVELSGYALRLIEEKERVAKKFEEQNDFLKNELTALRREISALRDIVGGERGNQAAMGQILLDNNTQLQRKLAENYELQITNYETQLNNIVGAGLKPAHDRASSPTHANSDDRRQIGAGSSDYVCVCHRPGHEYYDNKYYIFGFWLFAIFILIGSLVILGGIIVNI
ncbi:MAG: helix-turn-helix domain-containing protein [Patescibacteria group bacterium]